MKVYKFGGASVKDASGIRNLAGIISGEADNLVIVVSAFGKTTNALEKFLKSWLANQNDSEKVLEGIFKSHLLIVEELFLDSTQVNGKLEKTLGKLKEFLSIEKNSNYDFNYDQVVSYGEIWSTIIVAEYLKICSYDPEWIDIRENLITDDTYRDANILWDESDQRIRSTFNFIARKIYVTQGFIGGTHDGKSTTLGREGSDYTAAIIANILDAEYVTVWKDVPGILNADPDWLTGAVKLDEISYKEAVEMTFSGAKVIHPKTIKPLHNKNIPLHVRSFINPEEKGTIIKADATLTRIFPFFIKKEDQILISILPKDFSFVMGENLSMIFQTFIQHGIKVNLVEASAVSLDVCVDDERPRVDALLKDLHPEFSSMYNENVEMITVRHYNLKALEQITAGREILLEQRTRSTARYVVRK
jgi:aspartate kinase